MMKEFETYLDRIAERAMQNKNIPHFPGLYYGKMGIAVFLCQYSSYIQNTKYVDLSFDLIKEIGNQIFGKSMVNYNYGLSGIGTAIEYLVQNSYMEADTDDILEDFDMTLSLFLSEVTPLSSFNQILDMGKYYSYRINNTKKQNEIIFMIEKIILIIEMEIARNSFCSVKTLLLLNSLSHVSDNANKLFVENFKIQNNSIRDKNNLQWEYLHIKLNNISSNKSFNFKTKSVIELNINNTNQQLIEQIMLQLKSGNEVDNDALKLLLQKVETGKYCLYDGQIGAGFTLLSFLDKKDATWLDLL